MKKLSHKNFQKLNHRVLENAVRTLKDQSHFIDFSSNDYLGFANSELIFELTHEFLVDRNIKKNGATGSRLLSGNHPLYNEVETFLSEFHQSESATIFNSGYDANIGFFSAVPQRGDIILYDEFIHASIRDGIQLSNAKSYKFKHHDVADLEKKILHYTDLSPTLEETSLNAKNEVYVVTESVFSVDGDSPDLTKMAEICKKYNVFFVVDEAHAVGVFNAGIIQELNLQNDVFARIITFGKALGCHGAVVLGSKELQQYLVNFARSLIYTTGLPPHSLATIKVVYQELLKRTFDEVSLDRSQETQGENQNSKKLQENIHHFIEEIKKYQLNFIPSCSAIHSCVIPGAEKVKIISQKLQEKGFDVKAILSPTVTVNKERLRFCIHSYNSKKEISEVLRLLSIFAATELDSVSI